MQSQLSVDLIVTQAGGTLSKKRQGQNVCEGTVITVKEEKCQNCDPKGAFHPKKGQEIPVRAVPLAEAFRSLLGGRAAFLL